MAKIVCSRPNPERLKCRVWVCLSRKVEWAEVFNYAASIPGANEDCQPINLKTRITTACTQTLLLTDHSYGESPSPVQDPKELRFSGLPRVHASNISVILSGPQSEKVVVGNRNAQSNSWT
ncbi:hypothetical protein PDE_08739 [Penicillium oxalicum 114-2]|uniref:Uncharacterized protein n=1 Tax=Penicillium oxalicum (strain 114-2 / CGMCC 5302) TaxID=933388 RepID=S8BFB0_PENO1|nr:hypothetical protein PDE_08739 [Penicillium oxalicum 114-2]